MTDIYFEKVEEDGPEVRAVFRNAATNESFRLDESDLERIRNGDLEHVDRIPFPEDQVEEGLRALTNRAVI